jgi:recombinational DNA repair protein RecR
MPTPGTIDPSQSRERLFFETDEQYAARMKHLDHCDALLAQITTCRKFCPACGYATGNPDCHICANWKDTP